MDTKIYLYKVPISRNRNCHIDSILTFLSSSYVKKSVSFLKCGYVQIDYRIVISLSLSQNEVGKPSYNYCRINQDGRDYFYFIQKANWVSMNSVAFTMMMDTIQTYWDDFEFSKKTTIIREHQNRWNKDGTRSFDLFDENMHPSFDGLSTPVEIKPKTTAFTDYGKCYLVWLANSEITPEKQESTPIVPCLFFDNKYTFLPTAVSSNSDFVISDPLKEYYITSSTGDSGLVDIIKGSETKATVSVYAGSSGGKSTRAVRIYPAADGHTYHVCSLRYTGGSYPFSFSEIASDIAIGDAPITIRLRSPSIYGIRYLYNRYFESGVDGLTLLPQIEALSKVNAGLGRQKALTTASFVDFDRASTYISSIIQIPYAPVENESDIAGFVPGFNLLKLRETSDFSRILVDHNFYKDIDIDPPAAIYDTLNIDYESKLFTSEFYQRTYLYGDNQFVFGYEKNAQFFNQNLQIEFKVSKNMTNDFVFHFASRLKSWGYFDVYANYMFCSESSQIPVYNSSYIDYIRNGYNYDQYVTKKNNTLSVINTIGSGIATAASLAGGGGAVGPGILAGKAVSYGLKGISAFASIDSNNRQMRSLLNEKASASPTTTGNSSIDLRPFDKLMVYTKQCREEVRQQLYWKFYYTGYSHPCQEVPDFTSRSLFNYVECYPVFVEEETAVYADYLDDIRNRFTEGVTTFHYTGGDWNLKQTRENREVILS